MPKWKVFESFYWHRQVVVTQVDSKIETGWSGNVQNVVSRCSREILALWNLWIESTLKLLGKVSADSAWDACIPGGCDLPREPWMSIGAVLVVNLLEVFSVDTHDVLLHVVILLILVLWHFMIYDGLFHVCVSKLGCFPVVFPKWCMSAVQVCSPSTKTSTSPSCGMSSPRCVGCGLRGHGVQRLNDLNVLILILGSKHGQPMTVAVGKSK